MNIQDTRRALEEMKGRSEKLAEGFYTMATVAPQLLNEDDFTELRSLADAVAANLSTCVVHLYTFGRMSPQSKYFMPTMRIQNQVETN